MDASEEEVPYVFVDDEAEAPPPRRRRSWLWAAPAAILLLTLGGAVLFHGLRPTAPVSAAVVPIAVADLTPLEEPPAPAESAPEPPPAPPPPPAKTEPVILAEDPLTVVEEEPVIPHSTAPSEHLTKVMPPVPSAPAPSESLSIAKELDTAAAAIGDAKPLLFQVVDNFDPPAFRNEDVRALAARMDRVEKKLRDAQSIYFRLKDCGADSVTLDRRLETIRDLLEALREGRARIRVPLTLKTADVLREEAAPLAKEALEGFQPYSHEAQALDVRAEVALGKLREARRLYASIRNEAPDPERVDQRLKSIDGQIDDISGRYPQANAAN
jgi:hypothetical protein